MFYPDIFDLSGLLPVIFLSNSAAHCQMGNVTQYLVITGLYEYEDISENPLPDPITILTVQEQIIHPNYDAAAIDNDVMLLRLSQSVSQ